MHLFSWHTIPCPWTPRSYHRPNPFEWVEDVFVGTHLASSRKPSLLEVSTRCQTQCTVSSKEVKETRNRGSGDDWLQVAPNIGTGGSHPRVRQRNESSSGLRSCTRSVEWSSSWCGERGKSTSTRTWQSGGWRGWRENSQPEGRRSWQKKKRVRGCWIVVKRKGKNGQNTGSVMRRCRTWRKKPWKNEELRSAEEALPTLTESLGRSVEIVQSKTGVGCDGFHSKVPLDLAEETRGEIVEFLEKVEQSGKWPQQACTTIFSDSKECHE